MDRGDLVITHPEKVLFPEDGITKADLCAYYETVAPLMLPHVRGRPLTLERFPGGIGQKGFIQKDVSRGFPPWLERVVVEKRATKDDAPVHYPLVGDLRSLLWLANQNCITPHVWCSRVPRLEFPDLCVIDLDPSADDAAAVRRAALLVREIFDELGVPSFVKTSGSKGFHIVVPLDGDAGFDASWRFARGTGAVLVKRHPELFTQEFIKADRGARIFVDTGRNAPGATFAAAYAVRPRPGAPVSAPCTWAELERGEVGPQSFTLRTMGERVQERGDVWRDLPGAESSLKAPMNALERLLTDEDWAEAHAAATRRPVSRKAPRKR